MASMKLFYKSHNKKYIEFIIEHLREGGSKFSNITILSIVSTIITIISILAQCRFSIRDI